ncbi:hypothetical protein FBR05_04570 [Deltaproteobacteria bacterium PRO3]|nr:hypothetical protein [Deltaproteobacteria bacterium PRO3]
MTARKKNTTRKSTARQGAKKGGGTRKKRSKVQLILKTELSPQLHWMYPYLRKAKLKMPNLVLPRRIRSFRPTKTKIMRVLGNAYFDNRTVVIATHTQTTYMNRKGELKIKNIVRLPKARILDTLAHEIAHFQYADHGYEHEEFTRSIFKTFGLKERCPYCKGTGKVQLEGKP